MKRIFIIIVSLFFLTSCTDDMYFKNCVKDAMKVHPGASEGLAATYCENAKRNYPNKFRYLKGKVFSK